MRKYSSLGDFRVRKDILSVGICRRTNFDSPISIRKMISASFKTATVWPPFIVAA